MKFKVLFILLIWVGMTALSCNDIDSEIYEIVGVYYGNVVGIDGPFEITISTDGRDDISIEAPFDGTVWSVIKAEIDNKDDGVKDINIKRQSLGSNIEIWGGGFYTNGTFQIDYSMNFGNDKYNFRIVASK